MKHEVTSTYPKTALSNALKKLMETKPFSKITVSEIIADCGLNRKTFYFLFEDTRDLLASFYTYGIVGIIILWLNGKFKLDKSSAVKYVTEIFKDSLTGLIEHADESVQAKSERFITTASSSG